MRTAGFARLGWHRSREPGLDSDLVLDRVQPPIFESGRGRIGFLWNEVVPWAGKIAV